MMTRPQHTLKKAATVPERPQASRVDGSRAAKTRARILAAAHEVFGAETYTRASLREITERADVNIALVSRYFGSKEKLFETVVDDALTRTRLWGGKHANFGKSIVDLLITSRRPPSDIMSAASIDQAENQRPGPVDNVFAAAPSSPLLMLMHSASDRNANDVALRIHRTRVLLPLAAWLGPPDAEVRAAEILMMTAGFLIHRVMLPTGHFSDPIDPHVRDWLETTFQRIVDAGSDRS